MTYDAACIVDYYTATIAATETGSGIAGAEMIMIGEAEDDWLKLSAQVNDALASEYAYWTCDVTDFEPLTFPFVILKYKTGDAATGMGACACVRHTAAEGSTAEWILGTGVEDAQFSSSWSVVTDTLTTDKMVDAIELYINDTPDSTADSPTWHHAWFDFVAIFKGQFTFPFITHHVNTPMEQRDAVLDIPGRVGDRVQPMGMKSPIIELQGTMDSEISSSWKNGPTGIDVGDALYAVWFEAFRDAWVWLETDTFKGKVRPVSWPQWMIPGDGRGDEREFTIRFRKLDTCCGSNYTYRDYFGLSL